MQGGIIVLVFSILLFFNCSEITQYLSEENKKITITTSKKFLSEVNAIKMNSDELVIFYNESVDSANKKRNFVFQKSDDERISWSVSEKLFDIDLEVRNVFVTQLWDNSLMLVFNEISNDTDSQDYFYMVRSYDFTETFTAPRMIKVPGYNRVKLSGEIIQMGKSILLIPFQAENKKNEGECSLILSRDKGRNWEEVFKITENSSGHHFTNPVLMKLDEMKVYCLLEAENGFFYSTFSTDTGKTWTRPEKTNLYGSSADLMLSSNGCLVCCYLDETPQGLSMMKSFDKGKTWEQEIHLISGFQLTDPDLVSLDSENAAVIYSHKRHLPESNTITYQIMLRSIYLRRINKPGAVAASLDDEGVRLRWNKVDNASYYIIYRMSSPDSVWDSDNRIVKTSFTQYLDSTIKNTGDYYYSISAVEGYGQLKPGTGSESELSHPVLLHLK